MRVRKAFFVVGLPLVSSLAALALAQCTPTPTLETEVVRPTLTEIPVCPGTFSSLTGGLFAVVPQGDASAQVCVQPPAQAWGEMTGTGNAHWEHGVGTFLNYAARVYFPNREVDILMHLDTEIRLPADVPTKTLQLVGGTIGVYWEKLTDYLTTIQAGGTFVDPESAAFEVDYDREGDATEVRVYSGTVTVSRSIAGQATQYWDLLPWQRAVFEESVEPTIQSIVESPSLEVQDWLDQLGLPTTSPRQTDDELGGDPTLDPVLATDRASQQLVYQLLEGLYSFDAKGNVIAAGATSLELSEDGRTYTLYLRKDAFWSDGVPVTAEHYVDGICRAGTTGEADLLSFIAGFEAYNVGKTSDCGDVGVRALDDYTLQISVVRPLAYLPNLLTTPLAYPVRLDIIEKCGDAWTEPDCFVSNGPYTLQSWKHGASLSLERNTYYWNANAIETDRREFFIRR